MNYAVDRARGDVVLLTIGGSRQLEVTRDDALIHRSAVKAINGLTDFLTAERKRVPQDVVGTLRALRFSSSADTTHT